MFTLPELPYSADALAPSISADTLAVHHGKHHATYIAKLNDLVKGKPEAEMSLLELVKTAEGGLFNQAAQSWNHEFYWHSLNPESTKPESALASAIEGRFGNQEKLQTEFSEAAIGQFGSGWAWLVVDSAGQLQIRKTSNADNPVRNGDTPLLTCDVWEHAYYLDYKNQRPKYVEAWWKLANWEFASANFDKAQAKTPA